VDELGKFSCKFKVQENVSKKYKLRAIFEGDEHYARSVSNSIMYETVSHDTKLMLEIDTLRLSF
jgi:hypothetical protein